MSDRTVPDELRERSLAPAASACSGDWERRAGSVDPTLLAERVYKRLTYPFGAANISQRIRTSTEARRTTSNRSRFFVRTDSV